MQVDNTDSASLHFESILESDINHVSDSNSNDNSGFLFDLHRENYDIPRNSSRPQSTAMASYENTNVNNDIERKKRDFSHKFPNYAHPKNELTDNALFNKFRDAADGCSGSTSQQDSKEKTPHWPINDTTMDNDEIEVEDDEEEDEEEEDINADESNDELSEGKLRDSNSVSCEDLLEFADKKPKGKERGIDSDEVRIMTKVLGSNVSKSNILNF